MCIGDVERRQVCAVAEVLYGACRIAIADTIAPLLLLDFVQEWCEQEQGTSIQRAVVRRSTPVEGSRLLSESGQPLVTCDVGSPYARNHVQ